MWKASWPCTNATRPAIAGGGACCAKAVTAGRRDSTRRLKRRCIAEIPSRGRIGSALAAAQLMNAAVAFCSRRLASIAGDEAAADQLAVNLVGALPDLRDLGVTQ